MGAPDNAKARRFSNFRACQVVAADRRESAKIRLRPLAKNAFGVIVGARTLVNVVGRCGPRHELPNRLNDLWQRLGRMARRPTPPIHARWRWPWGWAPMPGQTTEMGGRPLEPAQGVRASSGGHSHARMGPMHMPIVQRPGGKVGCSALSRKSSAMESPSSGNGNKTQIRYQLLVAVGFHLKGRRERVCTHRFDRPHKERATKIDA